jgi:hypothetical protein
MKIELPLSELTISFPAFPKDCDSIRFYKAGLYFILNSENLNNDPSTSLQLIGKQLTLPVINNYYIIQINKRDAIKIEKSGDHLMFTRDDTEEYYWDKEEFQDDPNDVLGAIAGCLTLVINNPINDDKILSNELPLGLQVINGNYDTYDHESYQILAKKEDAEQALREAKADYSEERWVIEPVFHDELT